ncbi:MAG TPA: proton-conducting transporter membrane subunit [Verrucomicrobiota bacterium]|nr:proton-conducting transporter membrane subunit [Verrucomicrobiota bacterium]HNU52721.1 proton-conducting transporter membrane subunit [Verrucomicrobiota bacterium]
MLLALVLIPTAGGAAAFAVRPAAWRRGLLVGTALMHALVTALAWAQRPAPVFGGWLALDAPGLLFLSITSALFLGAAIYAVGYLRRESHGAQQDFEEGLIFRNEPEAVFIGCLLLFLATMTLVMVSQHLGVLWIAVEATTLASAPLIYFHRHHQSLEATWKYLLVCSVGIALALLGNFFLGVAAAGAGADGAPVPLMLADLLRGAPALHTPWLKAAFILLLVGYGTKMGLAPMHTWLPDAHSESPSVVSALLSGAVLNCAFVGILRAFQVCHAAGQAAFAADLLVTLGLFSMGIAAVFIVSQTDYKRLLAYSSVEHMGILALGVGIGGAGAFGSAWHAVNHSLTKAMLFLVAGNILTVYRTKSILAVRGVLRAVPATGLLWLAGFLAITGTPPFGLFFSKLSILKAALDQQRTGIAALYLGLLAVIYIGLATAFLRAAQGEPPAEAAPERLEHRWLAHAPPAVFGLIVLCLGLHLPGGLRRLLEETAALLGGGL